METLDFIVSQLDPDKVTFKVPVFDDDDLAFAKMISGTLSARCHVSFGW